MRPQDLKYAATHEWARLEDGNIVTIGITDFAVQQLGDIVFLDLPKLGAKASRGSPVGVIESVKAAVDLYAPVSGEVVEVNSGLAQDFDTLSKDPFGAGWMAKIRVQGPEALAGLLSPSEYERHVDAEGSRH